jgi:hypothetical protein
MYNHYFEDFAVTLINASSRMIHMQGCPTNWTRKKGCIGMVMT